MQVIQPTPYISFYVGKLIVGIDKVKYSVDIPLRLLDCFRLVMPLLSDAFAAPFCDDCWGRLAAFLTGGGARKWEDEGMAIVSAICGVVWVLPLSMSWGGYISTISDLNLAKP